jgi:hypothetical protein
MRDCMLFLEFYTTAAKMNISQSLGLNLCLFLTYIENKIKMLPLHIKILRYVGRIDYCCRGGQGSKI